MSELGRAKRNYRKILKQKDRFVPESARGSRLSDVLTPI